MARERAVGPYQFLGRSTNWMPLPVSTVWMRYGTTSIRASRNQERSGGSHISLLHKFDHRTLRGSVDGHKQVDLARGGPDFCQVDVEVADRIGRTSFGEACRRRPRAAG